MLLRSPDTSGQPSTFNFQPATMIFKPSTCIIAQYTIRVDEGRRDGIAAGMKESGIPVGVYYPKCFHEQPVFEHLGYKYGDFSESEKASREVLSLPMHPFLRADEQQTIVEKLIERL